MRVRYDASAAEEWLAAVQYYDSLSEGLGDAFASEVRQAIDLVIQFPNGWPLMESGARRIRLNRFPFGIVYSAGTDEIYIAAIMHLHRRPGYWVDRSDE